LATAVPIGLSPYSFPFVPGLIHCAHIRGLYTFTLEKSSKFCSFRNPEVWIIREGGDCLKHFAPGVVSQITIGHWPWLTLQKIWTVKGSAIIPAVPSWLRTISITKWIDAVILGPTVRLLRRSLLLACSDRWSWELHIPRCVYRETKWKGGERQNGNPGVGEDSSLLV
jgi:hypothetical protein